MGAGVALTVSDTNQQISAHQVLQPVTTIHKDKLTAPQNRMKMETIYEVNEMESKKTSNYAPSIKQEVKLLQIKANDKIQVKKQPQKKKKDIPTQVVKQKNELTSQQKIEQTVQVVKQKQLPIQKIEREINVQTSKIPKNDLSQKREEQNSINSKKRQICQQPDSSPVKNLKIEVQPVKSKNIPVVQKEVKLQTKPNNQEKTYIKSNSNSIQTIKKVEELKLKTNGRENDNQKNMISPKKIIRTSQKVDEKVKQEKNNLPLKQKVVSKKRSEPKDNLKSLIPSIDRQNSKQQKPITSKPQLKKQEKKKEAVPLQSDKSAINLIKTNNCSSSEITSSTFKNTIKDVSQHLKRQNTISDANITNETKNKKENNIPTNQQISINQKSRVDKKQRKNMVPIDSLFVCTEAFNSVQLEKTPNKEDKHLVVRPQSKKKTIKMSRDRLRKGLTITEKENDLLLETTQKIDKNQLKETSKNIQERYSNKNLVSMKSLAEVKVEQQKKKQLQTQKVEELNRKIMLQDKKNRKKQTKALKKIYNV